MSLRTRLPEFDSIIGLEGARVERFLDGIILESAGRRMGAIYLVGYYVEMTLKCAFFRLLGFDPTERISKRELQAAARIAAEDLGVRIRSEGYHGLQFWALAITNLRDHLSSPLDESLALELSWRSQRMNANWTPRMRYTGDAAHHVDWLYVEEDARWVESNYEYLVSPGIDQAGS